MISKLRFILHLERQLLARVFLLLSLITLWAHGAALALPLDVFSIAHPSDAPAVVNNKQAASVAAVSDLYLTGQAKEAAKLLGIEDEVQKLLQMKSAGKTGLLGKEALRLQLFLIRRVMAAGLTLRTTSAKIDKEIIIETQALDKLIRQRDFVVALTNNANFLQLSILSIIIDGPLEESHSSRNVLYGNRLNIVSGFMVGGFAGLALLEQKGGFRKTKAQPNMLGQTFGLDAPSEEQMPPMLWNYLNSKSPDYDCNMTRRERLLQYWKTNKLLAVDVNRSANQEKLAVLGRHHSKWSETIKLISARRTMLFDLRAMIDLLNTGLVDLLRALD